MKIYKINICRKFTNIAFLIVLLGNFSFIGQLFAHEVSSSNENFVDRFDHNWPRASDSELEQLRGGFLLPNGMNIEFSIERVMSLNGVETFSSFFQLPENGFLLQNGDGNMVVPDLAASALNSVIQNSLDDQVISTINDINLEISNLQDIDLNDNSRVFTEQIMPNIF